VFLNRAIEVITSQTVLREIKNRDGEVTGTVEEIVWNPTVANLSLMALGSSAPEIFLSVLETVILLDDTPGELGPSTIVGSAAFNLLMITAVSIYAVGEEPKKIDDVGVFIITAIFSVWAYVWMFIVLKVWTPEEVTALEAWITLVFTFLLIGLAYAADLYRQRSKAKAGVADSDDEAEGEDETEVLEQKIAKSYLRTEAKKRGESFVLECVTGGPHANSAPAEVKEDIKEKFKKTLKVDSLDGVDLGMLLAALQADNPIERIAFRKENATATRAGRRNLSKVMVTQAAPADGEKNYAQNPKVGFKCLHYVVSESCGNLEVKIAKKVSESIVFVVKCIEGTAKSGTKFIYDADEMITMDAKTNEHVLNIKIVDDDEFNEDLDFTVEIQNVEGKRMEGDDTQTRITIKDEDLPGTICFDKRKITVRKMDKFAYIQLTRKDGAAG
jgi:solute carrier family 8 (sodium/calcium exchanger)